MDGSIGFDFEFDEEEVVYETRTCESEIDETEDVDGVVGVVGVHCWSEMSRISKIVASVSSC